jgi:hypothetical protein
MKILFFLLFGIRLVAFTDADLKRAFRQGDFQLIIRQYQRNPGFFHSASRLNLAARAFHDKKDFGSVVRVCARSVQIRSRGPCGTLLSQIRKRSPGLYQRESGWFFIEQGDPDSAFPKFYSLSRKHPTDPDHHFALARIFQQKRRYVFMREQLGLARDNKQTKSLLRWLKLIRSRLEESLEQPDETSISDNPDPYYSVAFLSQKASHPYLRPLMAVYKSWVKESGSVQDRLRLANLHLILAHLGKVESLVLKIEAEVRHPYLILSLESLKSRLQIQLESQKIGKMRRSSASSTKLSASVVMVEPLSLPKSTSSSAESPGLEYFDFSELKRATLQDLSVFVELHRGFTARIATAQGEKERRWIYEQVRQEFMEMDSSHLDPLKHPVEAYFQTPDGKEFGKKLEELRQRARAEDQENARWFSGEGQRLDLELRQASQVEDRKHILRRYFYQWKRIQESEYTDLRVRGAWEAYLDSPEGELLMRAMDKELDALGMKKPQTPLSPRRQY